MTEEEISKEARNRLIKDIAKSVLAFVASVLLFTGLFYLIPALGIPVVYVMTAVWGTAALVVIGYLIWSSIESAYYNHKSIVRKEIEEEHGI